LSELEEAITNISHDKQLPQTTYTDAMTYDLHDSISTVLPHLGTHLLTAAKRNEERLSNDEDSEALHDFRVSVRHLRSFLKSYEGFIKSAKKHRRRFSDIMTLTNTGRDSEVHLAWLKAQQMNANDLEQGGIHYLLGHLSSSDHVDLEKVKKQFTKSAESTKESFALVTSKVLQRYGQDLAALLASIEKAEDDAAIHQARITGKKLRYTLELLENKEATALVKRLKKFQNTAGDLHDLQVLEPKVQTFLFAETLSWSQAFRDGSKRLSHDELNQLPELQRSYGLAAVQRRLEEEKIALFQDLTKHWLGASSQDFFNDLSAFSGTLEKATEEPAQPTKSVSKKAKKPAEV
jgi:CHAD domain-containing protein